MLRMVAIFCVLFSCSCLNAASLEPLGQVEKRVKKRITNPKVPFTVGVWGYTRFVYQQGNDMGLPFRMLRMNYMNFMHRPWRNLSNPDQWADDMKNRWVPFAEKYHVYISPNVENIAPMDKSFDPDHVNRMVDKYIMPYKDNERILMWYFKDEPKGAKQYELFLRTKDVFQKKISNKPLIVLFQCDWTKVAKFGPLGDILIHDHYPVGNPWAHHGWTGAMENFGKGRPQYVTLAAHDYIGGIKFPTIADIRLQTYINVARGADGINYTFLSYTAPWWYRKNLRGMVDSYGNPYGDVWEKLGQMSKDLLPAGQCLAGAKPIAAKWLHSSGKEKRPAIEVKALQPKNRSITYLVAFSNNVLVPCAPLPLKIDAAKARGKKVFSLYSFKEISKRNKDGSLTFSVNLDAGDGEILVLANERQFKKISSKVQSFRYENELVRYRIVREDADRWKISAPKAEEYINQAVASAESNDFVKAEKLAVSALAELQKQMNLCEPYMAATRYFKELQHRFGQVERKLEKLSDPFILGPSERLNFKDDKYKPFVEYHKKVSKLFPNVWTYYRKGNIDLVGSWYKKIKPQLVKLENCVLDIQAGGVGKPN